MVSRRDFLKSPVILSASAAVAAQRRGTPRRILVVGGGAFGGWTALHLRRAGAEVTLIDAWGPGNTRASSGGETRIIRTIYGPTRRYVDMASRALGLWREWDRAIGEQFYRQTGVLWMASADDSYISQALPFLRDAKLQYEHLNPADAARRWPQINFKGIKTVVFEPEAGYLLARHACDAVTREFVRLGGGYRQVAVASVTAENGRPKVSLTDGSRFEADTYVFACGPWLGQLFPDVIAPHLKVTRQEIFYLGTPAGDARFFEPQLPVWVEIGKRFMYGIPGNLHRGFKVADDTRGPEFDPTSGERNPTQPVQRAARDFVRQRFPEMQLAPVLGAEVCQYENTPDGHFIIDRHPAMPDLWLAGGGSGHGYKMGPVIGEMLARHVLEDAPQDPFFGIARFAR
jgi:monomeric sarcosine oxidase